MEAKTSDFKYFLIGLSCLGIVLIGLIALPIVLIIVGAVILLKSLL